MLRRRVVPQDVVQVVAHRRVSELLGVAYHCLEVALRRGDEVGVVKEEVPRKVVPAQDAVLRERPREYSPSRT